MRHGGGRPARNSPQTNEAAEASHCAIESSRRRPVAKGHPSPAGAATLSPNLVRPGRLETATVHRPAIPNSLAPPPGRPQHPTPTPPAALNYPKTPRLSHRIPARRSQPRVFASQHCLSGRARPVDQPIPEPTESQGQTILLDFVHECTYVLYALRPQKHTRPRYARCRAASCGGYHTSPLAAMVPPIAQELGRPGTRPDACGTPPGNALWPSSW